MADEDSSNDAERNFSSVHEHVLVYARPGFSFLGYELSDKNTKIPMATFAAGIPQTP